MLTVQVDRLRETAHEVERIKDNNADWLWRDGITLMDAARELRDAANTIENLRNRLTEQTCHNVARDREDLVCSVCGCYVENIGFDWSYCPSCGRRVI